MAESTDAAEAPEGPGFIGRLVRGVVALLGLIVVGLGAGGTALVYPYVRNDMVLDRVVRAVALEWRDFGREKAEQKLQFELDREGISGEVGSDSCKLDDSSGLKHVGCRWAVRIALPVAGSVPLSFASDAEIDASGELR